MDPYFEDEWCTIWCADAREVLPRLDVAVDHVITDPPYGVNRHGEMLGFMSPNADLAETHSRGYADHDPDVFRSLIRDVFTPILSGVVRPGGLIAAFGSGRTIHQLVNEIEALGAEITGQIAWTYPPVWAKAPSMLAVGHEPCVTARVPGPKSPVVGADVIAAPRDRSGDGGGHLTPKPQKVMRAIVEALTQPGELILDPFAGSGSTAVAARSLSRRSILIEREERFCEVPVRRLDPQVLDLGGVA